MKARTLLRQTLMVSLLLMAALFALPLRLLPDGQADPLPDPSAPPSIPSASTPVPG